MTMHDQPRETSLDKRRGVRPETINKRIRDIRQLLDQAGHTIQPGPHHLTSLDDLYRLAGTVGIGTPLEIKAACL
jgi:hypothetical protein